MIKLEEFLLKNIKRIGSYALVTYNDVTEAIWFEIAEDEAFLLESPCELYKISKVGDDIEKFCKKYMQGMVSLDGIRTESADRDYIDRFIKPMIFDGWFYGIDTPRIFSYLPKEVDSIKLISERECLEWLLKHQR